MGNFYWWKIIINFFLDKNKTTKQAHIFTEIVNEKKTNEKGKKNYLEIKT